MTVYSPPLEDIRFVATKLAGFGDIATLDRTGELNEELFAAILAEGGKFASGKLAPLNRIGDRQGSRLENGVVRTPDGWEGAYRSFVDGGWNAVPFDEDFGGQ